MYTPNSMSIDPKYMFRLLPNRLKNANLKLNQILESKQNLVQNKILTDF